VANNSLKVARVTIICTILVGSAAAIKIDEPSGDEVFSNTDGSNSEMSISVSGANGDFDIWIDDDSGSPSVRHQNNVSEADVSSYTFDAGDYDANTGAITVKLNDTESGQTPETEVELDTEQPELDDSETFPSPDESVSDERPDVELRFDDSPAGVDGSSVDASFQDADISLDRTDETDGDGGGATFEPDEDLSSEESYTVDWSPDDEVGTTGDTEFAFPSDTRP